MTRSVIRSNTGSFVKSVCNISKFLLVLLFMAATISCTSDSDAIKASKDFIKKAATSDPTLKDVMDFESVFNKIGTTEEEAIKKEGAAKIQETKDAMVKQFTDMFGLMKNNYDTMFRDYKVDEKGDGFWIVSVINPDNNRILLAVKKRNGKLKVMFK